MGHEAVLEMLLLLSEAGLTADMSLLLLRELLEIAGEHSQVEEAVQRQLAEGNSDPQTKLEVLVAVLLQVLGMPHCRAVVRHQEVL